MPQTGWDDIVAMKTNSGKKKIIIVEDHPLFRVTLAEFIEKDPGLTVCGQTDNVTEALALIEQTQPDAAIVDLTLNGSDGIDLIKELTARNSTLPVLVLSMHAEWLYAERVLRAGAKGYVSKRESPAEVAAALRTVLDGAIYVGPRVDTAILERLGLVPNAVLSSGRDPAVRTEA